MNKHSIEQWKCGFMYDEVHISTVEMNHGDCLVALVVATLA